MVMRMADGAFTTVRDEGIDYTYQVRWGDSHGKTVWVAPVFEDEKQVGTTRGELEGRGNNYGPGTVDKMIVDAVEEFIERGTWEGEA